MVSRAVSVIVSVSTDISYFMCLNTVDPEIFAKTDDFRLYSRIGCLANSKFSLKRVTVLFIEYTNTHSCIQKLANRKLNKSSEIKITQNIRIYSNMYPSVLTSIETEHVDLF